MLKLKNNNLDLILIIIIYILSLSIGLFINEDLSTGGSSRDFHGTWPAIVDFSNNKFNTITEYTRHVPLHYFLMSIIYKFIDNQYFVRIIYATFSLLLPFFLYLNLKKIYNYPNINLLLISFSLILFPYFRSSAIWPNSHLTALIFLTISNFFYLKSILEKKKIYFFLNLLFLAFSTYSLQTYVIFYLFYLYSYFIKLPKKDFFIIFIFCIILSLPGIFLLLNNERVSNITISKDFFYSFTTNFSLIGFFLLMLLFNKENFLEIKKKLFEFNKFEFLSILIVFFLVIFNFTYDGVHGGGGFYYKISKYLLDNNIIFFMSFLIGLILSVIFIKIDKNFLILFFLINGLNLNYAIYQKYFEPVFLVMILIFYKNLFISNILKDKRNVFYFNIILILYFIVAQINVYFGLSRGSWLFSYYF